MAKNTGKKTKDQETQIDRANAPSGAQAQDGTVEVLYQKMGNRWFAFSLVGDEVYVGSIAQDTIDSLDGINDPAALEPNGHLAAKARGI